MYSSFNILTTGPADSVCFRHTWSQSVKKANFVWFPGHRVYIKVGIFIAQCALSTLPVWMDQAATWKSRGTCKAGIWEGSRVYDREGICMWERHEELGSVWERKQRRACVREKAGKGDKRTEAGTEVEIAIPLAALWYGWLRSQVANGMSALCYACSVLKTTL